LLIFFISPSGFSRVFLSLEQKFEPLGEDESLEEEVQEEMRWKQALRDQMIYLNDDLLLNVVLNP